MQTIQRTGLFGWNMRFLSHEAHSTTFVYSIVMLIQQPEQPAVQLQHVGQYRLSAAAAA